MNLPGTTSNARTISVEGMKPDEKPVSSSGNPLPALYSRPWFFSLLPAADIRRTEVSLNTVQRRFAGFIRFIVTSALTKKGAESVVKSSETLLEAAKTSKANDIQGNVAVHADINHADSDGMSAIMHAAKNGNLGLIRTLVTAGSKINAVNNQGKTALMLAAKNGHVDVFDHLLDWGADITKREGKGLTALALAACLGKTALLQSFIRAGVAIGEPMSNGSTPLMFAAEAGHNEFVHALIENGADINQGNIKNRRTALMYAAAQGRTDVVELLLANKANVDARDKHDRGAEIPPRLISSQARPALSLSANRRSCKAPRGNQLCATGALPVMTP